jgi:hypothetical protein
MLRTITKLAQPQIARASAISAATRSKHTLPDLPYDYNVK